VPGEDDELLGIIDLPNNRAFVPGRGHDTLAVRAEGSGKHDVVVHSQDDRLASAVDVPDTCGLVFGRSNYALTIRTECGREDNVLVPLQDDRLASAVDLPDACSAIFGCSNYTLTVRDQHRVSLISKDSVVFGALSIPNARSIVSGGGDDAVSIGTEGGG